MIPETEYRTKKSKLTIMHNISQSSGKTCKHAGAGTTNTLRTSKLLASSKDVATISSPPQSIRSLEFHIKSIFTDMRKAP